MPHQVEAKNVKKGSYILIEDEPCKVKKTSKSAPGKHGHAKFKIQAEGVFDDKVRNVTHPGDKMMLSPKVEKKTGQIVSRDGQMAQVMDMDTYETQEMKLPEDLEISEGGEVKYWDIEGRKLIKGKKS